MSILYFMNEEQLVNIFIIEIIFILNTYIIIFLINIYLINFTNMDLKKVPFL